jgi:hypothetical protein
MFPADNAVFGEADKEAAVLHTIIAEKCVHKSSINNRSLEVNKSSLNQQADGACSQCT